MIIFIDVAWAVSFLVSCLCLALFIALDNDLFMYVGISALVLNVIFLFCMVWVVFL
jgi:hypothetical protein